MVKGEIWWANLPSNPYGSEPGKRRPVLIIQYVKINYPGENFIFDTAQLRAAENYLNSGRLVEIVIRRHPEYTGHIIMSFKPGENTYFWDTSFFR